MPIHRAYEPHNVVFDIGSILEGWNSLLPIGAHLALYRTELLPFANLAFVRTKPMPFSNRIYRLAATVAKWHPALVILLSCSKVMVMHSHEIGDGNLFSDLFLCFANGSILHPRSSNFLSINRFDCFRQQIRR